ncbi:MAG: hypothetical protein C0592_02590 [Marinilabiliales bacterium]|nr:MAG: hypothetical protein C0592_02590 [Marinilabiliales bacterium]
MKAITVLLFILAVHFLQAQETQLPDTKTMRDFSSFSGTQTSIIDGDSIISTWENGILNGAYTVYYSNGKIKAKGEYKNNQRTGKWLLYSSDGKGKLHISFNKYGSTTVKRVKNPGKGGVLFGRGKVYFNYMNYDMTFTDDMPTGEKINGVVKFRRGVKHGEQTEYYENGDLRSTAHFKYGLYEGARKVYFHGSRLKMESTYTDGKPDSVRNEYSYDGALIRKVDYRMKPPSAEQFYIDKFDISRGFITKLFVDSSFSGAKIFFPEGKKSFPGTVNQAFTDGKIMAYEDEELLEPYFPDHLHPDLSLLSREELVNSAFTGFILHNSVIFNQQTWLMYSYPLVFQCISTITEGDSASQVTGAYVYLPEFRREVPDLYKYLPTLKSQSYPYVILNNQKINNIENMIAERIRMIESEHAYWIEIYGL